MRSLLARWALISDLRVRSAPAETAVQNPTSRTLGAVDGGVFGCQGTGVAFKVLTTDGRTFETPEVTHQAVGSISIIVDGDRELRLAAHHRSVIEGSPDDADRSTSVS